MSLRRCASFQAEAQEPLDFAERMLAQLREGRRELPGGDSR